MPGLTMCRMLPCSPCQRSAALEPAAYAGLQDSTEPVSGCEAKSAGGPYAHQAGTKGKDVCKLSLEEVRLLCVQ